MLLWAMFAVVTSLVLVAILRPLFRGSVPDMASEAHALAVGRDQLAELAADEMRGVISRGEAEAARNEISRRLLAAARPAPALSAASHSWSPAVGTLTLVAVPAFAVAIYLAQGRPDLPGMPYAARIDGAIANNDLAALIVRVEEHLATRTDDVAGWRAIAPAYRSLGRYEDAAKAFSRILVLSGPSAALHADIGEALTLAAQGLVTEAAAGTFEDALKIDPANVKARYYRALAHHQDGASELAARQWQALLDSAPADAPWRSAVEAEIARAQTALAPELSDAQLAAGENLPEGDRQAMIRAMVEGLSQRLESNGNDLAGWLRLARARVVLGEPEKARQALDRAQAAFGSDVAALARIEQMRKSLPR